MGGLTVGDAIACGLDGVFSRVPVSAKDKARVDALLHLFADCIALREDVQRRQHLGTTNIADSAFINLTSGSQAFVLFLRAIVHQPAILVLDEPFQGMDSQQIARIQQYIDMENSDSTAIGNSQPVKEADLLHRRKSAVVLVSHYVQEWPQSMGEYILLQDGKVVERV